MICSILMVQGQLMQKNWRYCKQSFILLVPGIWSLEDSSRYLHMYTLAQHMQQVSASKKLTIKGTCKNCKLHVVILHARKWLPSIPATYRWLWEHWGLNQRKKKSRKWSQTLTKMDQVYNVASCYFNKTTGYLYKGQACIEHFCHQVLVFQMLSFMKSVVIYCFYETNDVR